MVANRIEPDGIQYNNLFEIRAIELEHELEKTTLTHAKKDQLNEELQFIHTVLKKKGITTGQNENNTVSKLNQLYKERKKQLKKLVDKISLFNSITADGKEKKLLSEEIKSLQKEITKTDTNIEKITPSLDKIEKDNLKANADIAISYSTFAIAGAGTLFSVLALLTVIGAVTAPPIMIPIITGFGALLAVIGLMKWTAEEIAGMEESQLKAQMTALHEENILDEALNIYDQQLGSNLADSSHAKYMKDLLSANTNEVSNGSSLTIDVASKLETTSQFTKATPLPKIKAVDQDTLSAAELQLSCAMN
nr:T4SS effector SidA family protein [Legionella norrlandica]